MRSARQRDEHRAALDRRLEQLQAELAGVRPTPGRRQQAAPAPEPTAQEPTAPETPAPETSAPAPEPPATDTPAPVGRHAARPGPRWTLAPGHLRVVAALLVLALLLTGWWLLRARPEAAPTEVGLTGAGTGPAATVEPADPGAPTPVDQPSTGPSPAAVPSADTDEQATGGQGAAGRVVVHVAGKVRRPGIVRLPPGSRVVDALEAAGGPRRGVALRHLNLARTLVDGEQVLVGVPGAAPPPAAGSAPSAAGEAATPVNLNTADQTELETLPGVGPVTAQKILDWRAEHGRFTAVEELLEVDGIGDATLADLAPLVTV